MKYLSIIILFLFLFGVAGATVAYLGGGMYVDETNFSFGVGTSTPGVKFSVAGKLFVGGDLIATGTMKVLSTASSTFNGSVGIGTSTPSYTLSIQGANTTSTTTLEIGTGQSATNGSCIQMYGPDGTQVRVFIKKGTNALVSEVGACNKK